MKWISVKDRAPSPNDHVLVYDKILELVYEAKLLPSQFFYSDRAGYSMDLGEQCGITHWMPLPHRPETNSIADCNIDVNLQQPQLDTNLCQKSRQINGKIKDA